MRSCPSSGAGLARMNGFDATRMKSRKAWRIAPWTASVLARSRGRDAVLRQRHDGAEHREDEDPQEHRALVVSPYAGELVDEGLRRVRVLDDVEDREVGGRIGEGQRREGEADAAGVRRAATGGATLIRTGSLVRVPQSGTANWISERPRASASAKCPASTTTGACPSTAVPVVGVFHLLASGLDAAGRPPPPAACRSRRAWRARCRP